MTLSLQEITRKGLIIPTEREEIIQMMRGRNERNDANGGQAQTQYISKEKKDIVRNIKREKVLHEI